MIDHFLTYLAGIGTGVLLCAFVLVRYFDQLLAAAKFVF